MLLSGERRTTLLALVWLAAVLSVHALPALPTGHRMGAYLAAHAAAFALAVALRALAPERAIGSLVRLGIAAQLAIVPAAPFTSTDSARYVWDGAVMVDGHDPYLLAPDDPALDGLALRFSRPPDHRDVPTCYPPVTLALFAVAASFGAAAAPAVLGLLLALAAIALMLRVAQALRERGRERDVLLLALSPLLLFETGVGAHLDVLVALAVTAAALAAGQGRAGRRRGVTAGAALGLAAALKVWPLVLVLVLVRHVSLPRFALGLAVGLSPFAIATAFLGHLPLGSLGLLAETWSFGSPVWWLLRSLSEDERTLRLGLAAGTMAGCALVGLRARRPTHALVAGTLVVLLLSPTVYPWYAVPLVPLAALTRWLRRPALALLLLLPCSYEVVDGYQLAGEWAPSLWPGLLTFAAALAVWGLDAWRAAGRVREPTLA